MICSPFNLEDMKPLSFPPISKKYKFVVSLGVLRDILHPPGLFIVYLVCHTISGPMYLSFTCVVPYVPYSLYFTFSSFNANGLSTLKKKNN